MAFSKACLLALRLAPLLRGKDICFPAMVRRRATSAPNASSVGSGLSVPQSFEAIITAGFISYASLHIVQIGVWI